MINVDDRFLMEADEAETFLMLHIAKYMGENDFCFPKNETLCKRTRWEIKKLQRVKARCVEKGFLSVKQRFDSRNSQTSNAYKVKTDRLSVWVNTKDKGDNLSQNGTPPLSQNGTPPLSQNGTPPLSQNGTPIEVLKGEVLNPEVLTYEKKSFPNAKKASGDTPPKTPWTKEVSSLFDKINEEAHRAANLEYGPFNWAAGGGRQFAALKKIRDAMIPDIERKLHHAPDEKEIQSGFEYLFRYGFEFFKKVADDKGGAINFTPSAILNSYNLILSHARANHTPRKSKQEQRIDDQHEARAAFYRELVSDLVETGDGGG